MSVVTSSEPASLQSKPDSEDEPQLSTSENECFVLFSNLPACLNESEMRRLFEDGLDDRLQMDHSFTRCLLTVHSDEVASALCNLNGHIFDDFALRVETVDSDRKSELQEIFAKERNGLATAPISERIAPSPVNYAPSMHAGVSSVFHSGSDLFSHNPSMISSDSNVISGSIMTEMSSLSHPASSMTTATSQPQSVRSVKEAMALIEAMAKPDTAPANASNVGASGTAADDAADELARTVYVGNVNPLVGEEHLKAFFKDCGRVLHSKILGSALHGAQKAYSKGGEVLVDRPLKVGKATNPIFKRNGNPMGSHHHGMGHPRSTLHRPNMVASSMNPTPFAAAQPNELLLALLAQSQANAASAIPDHDSHSRSSRDRSPRSHHRSSHRHHSHSRSRSRESHRYRR